MPMPGVFSAINTRIQGSLVGRNLNSLSSDLPYGEIVNQEGWVESEIVPGTKVYIKGKYDLLMKNKDGTHTLIDLKISSPQDDKVDKYKTQLNAYHFALEHPKNDNPLKITKLALLIFYPDSVSFENNICKVNFPPKWLEVPVDQDGFNDFMAEISTLLEGDPPKESPACKWCQYRHLGEKLTHVKNIVAEELPF